MPPPCGGKKKKGRAPKHQNGFAFQHNPKSKKTDKILASANVGVCKRCYEKIEWRKKYRKYKPRSQPGKCNLCFQKNVKAAYHTICAKCTGSEKAYVAMEKQKGGTTATANSATSPADNSEAPVPASDNNVEMSNTEEKNIAPPTKPTKRRFKVCAVCTTEPAMSKYANASGADFDIIEQIHALEDSLESGVSHEEDEHKLTLREMRSVERKIGKLEEELKARRKPKEEEEEEEGENDADGDENEGDDDDSVVDGGVEEPQLETDDPFLLATGGKAMVGEDYRNMLLATANERPPYQSAMQLASSSSSDSDEEERLVQTKDFGPGARYDRAIPDRFSADSDDLFMRSIYNNYATEGEDKDHNPTGNFFLTEANAKALCSEVLATHKGITGPALESYLATYWAKAWGHFDVNRIGNIPVLYANGLVRFLASDQYFQFINPK